LLLLFVSTDIVVPDDIKEDSCSDVRDAITNYLRKDDDKGMVEAFDNDEQLL